MAVAIDDHRTCLPLNNFVVPAKAGTQGAHRVVTLDPRFPRGSTERCYALPPHSRANAARCEAPAIIKPPSLPVSTSRMPMPMYFLHQLLGIDTAHAGPFIVLAAGGDHRLVGAGDPCMAVLAGDPHLGGEIVGADQQCVDAGNRGDRLGIGDRGRRLHQRNDEQRGIGGLDHLGDRDALEIEDRLRAGERAMADRRVFQVVDDLARLLGGVDMRHDDTERAIVEHACRHRMLHERHADDRRNAGVECRHGECGREIDRHRPVFEIDEQPVVAGCLHHLGDVDGARRPIPTPSDISPFSRRSRAALRTFILPTHQPLAFGCR